MAVIYEAQLQPTKIELLRAWASSQPWIDGSDASTLEPAGAYRFDDPEGEVGVETHVLRAADGNLMQIPVTYRGAALIGAEASLITTCQHSVLGTRWVYDGCGDPVYARTLAATILTGGTQADLELLTENGAERHVSTTRVWGSGASDAAVPTLRSVASVNEESRTIIIAGDLQLVVLRTIGNEKESGQVDAQTLLGTWPGHDVPSLLAFVLGHGSA